MPTRSISGSISPRPTPIPAAMRIGPLAAEAGVGRALSAVPARADLQGPGLGQLAVQRLRGQGPPHVARPRTAVRRPRRCRSGGPSRFRRTACWRRGWRWSGLRDDGGEDVLPRGVPRRIRGRPPDRRRGGDRRDPHGLEARSGGGARRRADRRQQAAPASADGRGAAARHFRRADASSPATANCSGATTGWNARCNGRDGRASFVRATRSSRIGRPAWAMCSLAWRMVYSPKWKIEAASTAVAWPSRMPSTRWSSVPTPPEAITGTGTASAIARVSAMSKPGLVPSRSIEVSRISPAPSADHLARIGDRIEAGRIAPAMGEDLPALGLARLATPSWRRSRRRCTGRRTSPPPPCTKSRRCHRRGVDRHLVGAALQQLADVVDGAHAAADRQRHEAGLGRARAPRREWCRGSRGSR